MATIPPLVRFLACCYAALKTTADSYEGRKALSQNDAPPRFVWIFGDTQSPTTRTPGGNPRALHDDLWSIEVHCWGKDLTEALLLRQGLVTAVRRAANGANYKLSSTRLVHGEEHGLHGTIATVSLVVRLPLYSAVIAPPDAPAETPVTDDTKRTVKPTSVEFDDTPDDPGTAGDGQLDSTES
jgi:hypothetical protein